jgi:hypothetical protein
MQGGFEGEMRCGWIDVLYDFDSNIIPVHLQSFFVPYAENQLEGFRLSHHGTLAVAYPPSPYGRLQYSCAVVSVFGCGGK